MKIKINLSERIKFILEVIGIIIAILLYTQIDSIFNNKQIPTQTDTDTSKAFNTSYIGKSQLESLPGVYLYKYKDVDDDKVIYILKDSKNQITIQGGN